MEAILSRLHTASLRMREVFFLQCLTLHLTAATAVFALIVLLDKSGLVVVTQDWSGSSVWQSGAWTMPDGHIPLLYQYLAGALLALAALAAVVRTSLQGFSRERAALALDERLGLKERITSATLLGQSELPLAQALVEDAQRHCLNLDVRRTFPLVIPEGGKKLPWLALGACAALFLMPDLDLLSQRADALRQKQDKLQDREKVDEMARDLAERARLMRQAGERRQINKERLQELTRRMEELAEKMRQDRQIDPERAKEMLNRLQDEMQKQADEAVEKNDKLRTLTSPRDQRSLMRKTIDKMRDNDLAGASQEMNQLRRRLMRNEVNPEELKQLQKEMEDLAKQLEKQGLQKLQKQFEKMADDLKQLQNSADDEKLRKLQEKMQDALKNLQNDEQVDLSKLTEEERELLAQLQEMVRQMEITEQMLQQMQEAAEEGKLRALTQEDLKRMLEQMKNQKQCPRCGQAGWDGKNHGGNKSGQQGQGEQGRGQQGQGQQGQGQQGQGQQGQGQQGQGQQGQGQQGGEQGGGEHGQGDGDGTCPVCGRKHGDGGGGGGMVGIPMPGGQGMNPGQGQGQGQGQGSTGGQGQGRGGRPPESGREGDFESSQLRARAILPGQVVGVQFVRGLPPGENKPKAEYTEAVEAVEASQETVREKEMIPREDRELIRQYHNRLKGVDP